jgi:transposase, IS5 family
MAHKNMSQMGFGDFLLKQKNSNQKLDQIASQIDWKQVENILAAIHDKKRGAKSFPPLLTFKCLLLQSWYDLSDYELTPV